MNFPRFLIGLVLVLITTLSTALASGIDRSRSVRMLPNPVQLYVDASFSNLFLDGFKIKLDEGIREITVEGKRYRPGETLPTSILDFKKEIVVEGMNGTTTTVAFPFVDGVQLEYVDDQLSNIELRLKNTENINVQGVESPVNSDGVFKFFVHENFEAKIVTLTAKTGIQVNYDLNFPFERDPIFLGAYYGGSLGRSIPGTYTGFWMKMLGPRNSYMDGLSVTLSAATSSDTECRNDIIGCAHSGLYEGIVGYSPFRLYRSRAFQPYFEVAALSQFVLVNFEKRIWYTDTTRWNTRNNTEFRFHVGASLRVIPIVLLKRLELAARLNWIPTGIHLNVKPDSVDTITDSKFLLFIEFGFSLWP